MLQLDWWTSHIRWVGIAAIAICLLTWATEISGLVYVCPYCRTQRTVIGLLGLLALLPNYRHWIIRYVAAVLGAYGFHVGAEQHFGGWKKIMSGKFAWGEQWYVNSWPLSGFAIFMIVALVLLIWQGPATGVGSDGAAHRSQPDANSG